ncbi:MAG: hypothetical protein JWM66_545, partial [Solirubrobacterales bacterium]|nr:hypothetical protein [Solirubrobacterales bacterium]
EGKRRSRDEQPDNDDRDACTVDHF